MSTKSSSKRTEPGAQWDQRRRRWKCHLHVYPKLSVSSFRNEHLVQLVFQTLLNHKTSSSTISFFFFFYIMKQLFHGNYWKEDINIYFLVNLVCLAGRDNMKLYILLNLFIHAMYHWVKQDFFYTIVDDPQGESQETEWGDWSSSENDLINT